MFVKYQINTTDISGTTATTYNIPITLEYQLVDNAELVERLFVTKEIEKAVNPILDYDKVRFLPVNSASTGTQFVTYSVNFLDEAKSMLTPTYYSNIGFEDFDIKAKKNSFKESYLNLSFYDTPNPLIQVLIGEIDLYSSLSIGDYYPIGTPPPNISGQVKPANEIPVRFILTNPLTKRDGTFEGYHLYAYKDEYTLNAPPKSLYMKATYMNAKTGKSINLMTESAIYPINQLINKLYTKYNLYRDITGFYYHVDTTYSNNVVYTPNLNSELVNLKIELYQIQVI